MKNKIEKSLKLSAIVSVIFAILFSVHLNYSDSVKPKFDEEEIMKTEPTTSAKPVILRNYGDIVDDTIIENVNGKPILISKENQKWKYIKIIHRSNTENMGLDHFTNFINLLNGFSDKNIDFIFLVLGEFNERKKKELSTFQKKYNFQIAQITEKNLEQLFKSVNCKCGLALILDKDNKTQFANTTLRNEIMKTVLESQLINTN